MSDVNPFDSLNDEAMADRLRKLADSPRFLSPDERAQLLRAVAARLDTTTTPEPVQLDGDFTYVPSPATGTLHHPLGEGGVFLADISYPDAQRVVESLAKISPDWTVRTP